MTADGTIKVKVKLMGTLLDFLPSGADKNTAELELPAGSTLGDAMSALNIPEDRPVRSSIKGPATPPTAPITAPEATWAARTGGTAAPMGLSPEYTPHDTAPVTAPSRGPRRNPDTKTRRVTTSTLGTPASEYPAATMSATRRPASVARRVRWIIQASC